MACLGIQLAAAALLCCGLISSLRQMPTISPRSYSPRHRHVGIRDKPNVGLHLSHTHPPTKEHFAWNGPESGDDAKTATANTNNSQQRSHGATKNVILALGELGKHKITLIRNSNVAHAK